MWSGMVLDIVVWSTALVRARWGRGFTVPHCFKRNLGLPIRSVNLGLQKIKKKTCGLVLPIAPIQAEWSIPFVFWQVDQNSAVCYHFLSLGGLWVRELCNIQTCLNCILRWDCLYYLLKLSWESQEPTQLLTPIPIYLISSITQSSQ